MPRYSITIQYHEEGQGRASAARDEERFIEAGSIAAARAEARSAFRREWPRRTVLGMVARRAPDLPRHDYVVQMGFVPSQSVMTKSYRISNCLSGDDALERARECLALDFPGHQLISAEPRRTR